MKEPPQAPAGRPRRVRRPGGGGHRLPPVRPRQKGNRDSCYACGLRFQYENECSQEVSP